MKNQSFYQEFSQRLCYLRKVTGLTQKNVADYLQLDRSAYSCYELRRSAPSLDKLCQLARLYRVSTDFLLGVGGWDDDKQFAYRFGEEPDALK